MAIDKNNKNVNLSDQNMTIYTNNLSSASSELISAVSNINVSGIASKFSPLTSVGIGSNLFSSLEKAFKSVCDASITIAKSIGQLASSTEAIDKNGYKNLTKRTGFNNSGGSVNNSSNISESDISKQSLDEISKQFSDYIIDLDDESQISLINELLNISKDDLKALLCDENASILLKQQLLKSPNISNDLKKIIAELDENEIKTSLKNLLIQGELVSDFSKILCTIFDENYSKYNINARNASSKLLNTYSKILDTDDIQNVLKEIYNGDEKYDNEVILFTRDYIDTLSVETKLSVNDLLSNSKYSQDISNITKDLAKTFTCINASKNMGDDMANTLYSNIIIKENKYG